MVGFMGRSLALLCVLGLLGCRPQAVQSTSPSPMARGADPVVASEPAVASEPVVANEPATVGAPSMAIDSYARLLPDTAEVVIGVDARALVGTKFWSDLMVPLGRGQAEFFAAVEECGVGTRTWRGAVLGVQPDVSESSAMVLVADGLGRSSTLDCLGGALAKANGGDPPWTRTGSDRIYEGKDGDRLMLVADDVVVMASKQSADAVEQLWRSGGRSALDPSLQPALAWADTTKHIWVVGRMPQPNTTAPLAGNVGKVDDFTGWLDLSFGARGFVALGVENPDAAGKVQEQLRPMLQSFGGMMGAFGVPSTVLENAALGTWGSATTIEVTMTPRELETMQDKVTEQFFPGVATRP